MYIFNKKYIKMYISQNSITFRSNYSMYRSHIIVKGLTYITYFNISIPRNSAIQFTLF